MDEAEINENMFSALDIKPTVVMLEDDPIVATVMNRMHTRSKEGIKKYGCTMEREDVTTLEWIDHAIEEQLDAAIYLERLKADVKSWQEALLEE